MEDEEFKAVRQLLRSNGYRATELALQEERLRLSTVFCPGVSRSSPAMEDEEFEAVRQLLRSNGYQATELALLEERLRLSTVFCPGVSRSRCSPVMSGGGATTKEKGTGKEGELVVTKPKLASLIYHSFNIAFVLEVVFFFAHILIYHRTTHDWWQALLGVAIVSPLFIAPLYVMPICRDVFVRAYAMAPSDIHSSDTSKPLICEIV